MLRIGLRALAPILLFAVSLGTAAPAAAETSSARREIPAGAFCTPASCRDGKTTALTATAFGAAVLVIHRSARRRSAR